MIVRPADLLIATASIPLLAAIGVSLALWCNSRRWGLVLARLGLAVGAGCAITLAILLNGRDGTAGSAQVTLGKWFSFSSPHAASITFGLDADLIKASLFGLMGIIALIAMLRANAVTRPFSGDLILTISLLYSAGAFFVFAPNLAQSLLGWGAISLLAAILIQLSHHRSEPSSTPGDSVPVRSAFVRQIERTDGWGHRILPAIASIVDFLEWSFRQAGQWLIRTLPNWLCDQAEVVVESPVNVQLLAAILGTSAILLTWLFMPPG